MLELFHFLRPQWLIAVPLILGIWWSVRPKKQTENALTESLAPHLARALLIGANDKRGIFPIDTIAAALILLSIAVSGPTWGRVPNALLAQTAPMVVALKVTPSMEGADIQPSRLQRAGFKIQDLMKHRAGAQTALFAYAGSAHRVSPLTQDPNIVSSYLQGLSASIMPTEGDRADIALELSIAELSRTETSGAVLFVLDDLNPANVTAFTDNAEERAPVVFLIAAPDSVNIPQLSSIPNSTVVRMTVDDSDIKQIERTIRSAYRKALLEDETQAWDDKGWLLAWPVALLILLTFRRGWTMQWALLLLLSIPITREAQADGIKDWFLTPDQQGWLAYNDKEYALAISKFQNPEWSAYVLLKNGQYEEAAIAYGRIETAEGAIGEAMANLRNRKYRDGVRSLEKALERDPGNEVSEHNLVIANAIVEYVESTQAQSNTGEESGIGADDTVFDNESGMGEQTQIERREETASQLTDDQWMRSVDTDVSDFLGSRFMLEASEQNK